MKTSTRSLRKSLKRLGERFSRRRSSRSSKLHKSRNPQIEQFESRLLLSITPSITGASEIDEGSTYELELSATGDTVEQWDIDWGDGGSSTGTSADWGDDITYYSQTDTWIATHVYADDYATACPIIATAYDDADPANDYSTSPLSVTVDNVAPKITINGPSEVIHSVTHIYTLQVLDPGDDEINSWTINWGDTDVSETFTKNPDDSWSSSSGDGVMTQLDSEHWIVSHAYYNNGDYTITATATDEDSVGDESYPVFGALDKDFGPDSTGWVTEDFGAGLAIPKKVFVQPDGKILVAGYIDGTSDYDFALARYNSDGTLDDDFGSNGLITEDLGGDDYCYDVALQSDGKIVLIGYSDSGVYDQIALVRYTAAFVDVPNTRTMYGAGILYSIGPKAAAN